MFDDHLCGMVVSTSDCHPRSPRFDSRLYPKNFSGSIASGMGSISLVRTIGQLLDVRNSEIWIRKLKLRLKDKHLANHKAPCTAIWQHPLQSVLALQGCSATDLICGPGSSSSKAFVYGLDGPGLILGVGGGGVFSSILCVRTGPGVCSVSYKMSTMDFPRG